MHKAPSDQAQASAPVSVVIPCFRNAGTIERAVKSAINQTWPPEAIIVVDDGSDDPETDRTLSLLSKSFPVLVEIIRLETNSGASNARNVGWDRARSPLIAFLDADDMWYRDKLATQVPDMIADPTIAMSAHIYGDFSPRPSETAHQPHCALELRRMLRGNAVSTPTVIVRSTVNQRFDPALRYAEDYDLWLRILAAGNRCVFIPTVLARGFKKPYGESGLSQNLLAMEIGELRVYRGLAANGAIGRPLSLVLQAWSFTRYCRRVVISRLAKRARGRPRK